jgi:hypothetical protein
VDPRGQQRVDVAPAATGSDRSSTIWNPAASPAAIIWARRGSPIA